jgi:hypothetical protein
MSEEYEIEETSYTPFYPLLVLLIGLTLWSGYQLYSVASERGALKSQFESAIPTINAAQNAKTKLYSLAQDLIQTGAKDNYAAQIVKEANIQMKNPDGSAAAPAPAPAPAPDKTP